MAITAEEPVRIGEVVEAATHRFVAQCYRLYEGPSLGALVQTASPPIYAVVYDVSTQSLDPGRPVIARGQEETTEQDLYDHNPQLSKLLTTRFQGLIVGYVDRDQRVHGLPPLPPRIHAFVYTCDSKETEGFTQSLDFLHLLVNSGISNVDEVIAVCLRTANASRQDGGKFLVQAGKALAVELTGQLPRLNAILRRLM